MDLYEEFKKFSNMLEHVFILECFPLKSHLRLFLSPFLPLSLLLVFLPSCYRSIFSPLCP